jgi:hypothetical protein
MHLRRVCQSCSFTGNTWDWPQGCCVEWLQTVLYIYIYIYIYHVHKKLKLSCDITLCRWVNSSRPLSAGSIMDGLILRKKRMKVFQTPGNIHPHHTVAFQKSWIFSNAVTISPITHVIIYLWAVIWAEQVYSNKQLLLCTWRTVNEYVLHTGWFRRNLQYFGKW